MADKKPPAQPTEMDAGLPAVIELPAGEEPTVQEHIERAALAPWQVTAVLARYHADGMTRAKRMPANDFDAAVKVALYGRV